MRKLITGWALGGFLAVIATQPVFASQNQMALDGIDLATVEIITDVQAQNITGMIQCTDYVAGRVGYDTNSKTKVLNFRSAKYWDDDASSAGYKVSSTPRNGSIMVLESWGKNTAGHVALVRNDVKPVLVLKNPDYSFSIDHANWDNNGKVNIGEKAYLYTNQSKVNIRNIGSQYTKYPVAGFLVRK